MRKRIEARDNVIKIIRRPRVDNVECALLVDETSGDFVVCFPAGSITAAGAEALGRVWSAWYEDHPFFHASLPTVADSVSHDR